MRHLFAIAALFCALGLAAGPVLASEPAKAKAKSDSTPGTNVDMPILVAPMSVDQRLFAYAYISTTIVTASSDAAIDVRDKTPFLQDAFIRDVNDGTIVDPKAKGSVDKEALKARFLADARRVVGASKVVAIRFSALQVTKLRPSDN